MDKLLIILFIVALLGGIFLIGYFMERNKEQTFRKRLGREFSKPMDNTYSGDRLSAITGYYDHHNDGKFSLDEITWNDFGMDQFIRKYNHSYSSVGDEYFYYRLRVPAMQESEAEFDSFEKEVEFFRNNEKPREDFQILMAKLGRSGRFSMYSYLEFLADAGMDQPVFTIIDWFLYIAFIVLMFFYFYPGLVLLISLIVGNVVVYLFRKKKIEPYFVCFEYILRIIKTAGKVSNLLPAEFEEEKKKLKKGKSDLSRISSVNLVFLQDNSTSAIGDIGNVFMNFIKMFFQLDIFLFYRMKKQVESNSDAVDLLFETLGKLDFAVNTASFRSILPYSAVPEFTDEKIIDFDEMIHPLLLENGVPNSAGVKGGILLTGSNASGKSTFLRMIGINAVLAQSMHTVYAKKYKAGFFRVFSSMSLKDSLESGESYYIAEIKSIKRILDAMEDESSKILCFVDEVLRGTNTKERIAAGCEIMRCMQRDHTLCFAATHDIELAHMLSPLFTNYHFDEEILEDDIHFPYQLKEGYATSRNAIALLRIMGYPAEITERALQSIEKDGKQ